MATDYTGWKVPKDVIIVAKECRVWNTSKSCYDTDGKYQGYVVDPDNKEMLKSALDWAKWTEYVQPYDQKTRTYKEVIEHEGIEHLFTNEGFTLELLDSANGSSQGGKLSFWNCKVSKDGKEFIVGIASDYLLEILLHNDFKNGVCQSTLSFARCKGGVGMMNKEMPSYQQFLNDEELRATLSKGKTKKRAPGHLYSTLTGGDVYFSTFYCWYEPVYEKAYNRYYDAFTGFRKLATPKVYYWQPAYNKEFTKKSEYLSKYLYLDDKIPARTDCGLVAEIDITDEDVLRNYEERTFVDDASTTAVTYTTVGLSTSKESYILPDHIRQWIISRGYKVLDE